MLGLERNFKVSPSLSLPLLANKGGDEGCNVRGAQLKGCVSLLVLHVDVSPFLHQEAGNGCTSMSWTVFRDARVLSHLEKRMQNSLVWGSTPTNCSSGEVMPGPQLEVQSCNLNSRRERSCTAQSNTFEPSMKNSE